MDKSLRHVEIFKKLLEGIRLANDQYAKVLLQYSEKFYQDISKEVVESEALLCCYDYIFNFISIISQHHKNAAVNLETKLLEPFSMFAENLKTTNKNLYKNGQSLIESLENTKSDLLEKQQIYYFRAQEAENFINNNLSTLNLPSSPERGSHTSYPSYEAINKQASVEKAAEEYKNMIVIFLMDDKFTFKAIMNEKCKIHSSQFYGIFENFDLNEESRFQFIKFNVSQILENFKETYTNIIETTKNLNSFNFESKVKQIENNIGKTKFGLASDVRIQLSGKQAISEQQKKHEFLSFETWKELYGNQKKQ